MLCTQAQGLAVNGSYAYVTAFYSDALVVVDVSNPASPVIRGFVVSSSLMNGVCDPGLRAWLASGAALHPHRLSCSHPRRHRLLKLSRALTRSLARSRVLCTQPQGLAMSGSYAYVAGQYSNSLVVIDVSNPASPVIRGSVVSSSLLGGVRVRPGASRARMTSGAAACVRPVHHARTSAAPPPLILSRALTPSLSRAVHTAL